MKNFRADELERGILENFLFARRNIKLSCSSILWLIVNPGFNFEQFNTNGRVARPLLVGWNRTFSYNVYFYIFP